MRTQRGRELAREAHTLTQHQQEQKTDPVRVLQLKAVRKKRVPLMYFCTFVLLGGKGVEGGGDGTDKVEQHGKRTQVLQCGFTWVFIPWLKGEKWHMKEFRGTLPMSLSFRVLKLINCGFEAAQLLSCAAHLVPISAVKSKSK